MVAAQQHHVAAGDRLRAAERVGLPLHHQDRHADDDAVASLITPPSLDLVERLELRPVSALVNSVRNNGPQLLEPLPPEEVREPIQLDLLSGPNPK